MHPGTETLDKTRDPPLSGGKARFAMQVVGYSCTVYIIFALAPALRCTLSFRRVQFPESLFLFDLSALPALLALLTPARESKGGQNVECGERQGGRRSIG